MHSWFTNSGGRRSGIFDLRKVFERPLAERGERSIERSPQRGQGVFDGDRDVASTESTKIWIPSCSMKIPKQVKGAL
jgi:hypothetical protein